MNICIHDFICFQAVFTPFEFTFDFMNLIFVLAKFSHLYSLWQLLGRNI